MIDAKELRIGNWVQNDAGIQWQFKDFEELADQYSKYGNREARVEPFPIPLSPEVLKNCGFAYKKYKGITSLSADIDDPKEKGNTHNWTFPVPKNDHVEDLSRFELVKFGDGEIKFHHQWLRVTVHSLHQLQNLYYSLTNKELNYKLLK